MFVRGFILLLCGAVLGPLADYLHLATATTRYPLRSFPAGGSLFGMPLWVRGGAWMPLRSLAQVQVRAAPGVGLRWLHWRAHLRV